MPKPDSAHLGDLSELTCGNDDLNFRQRQPLGTEKAKLQEGSTVVPKSPQAGRGAANRLWLFAPPPNFRGKVWNSVPPNSLSPCRATYPLAPMSSVSRKEPQLPAKTIGAALLTASVALANPAEARWRGWGWGPLGFGIAAGALLGGAIAASAYPSYGYGYGYPRYYGYGYPRYYGYGYPSYRVAYAYPSWGYGYYPRRAYYGYAYAPRYAYYPRRVYRAYAFVPGRLHRRWR